MRTAAPLLMALLLVVGAPSGAAASGEVAHAQVDGIRLGGELGLVGRLSSFRSAGEPAEGDPLAAALAATVDERVPPDRLELRAASLRIETNTESWTGSAVANVPKPHSETAEFSDAFLTGGSPGRHFMFFLAPAEGDALPSMEVRAQGGELRPTADTGEEQARKVPSDKPVLKGADGPAVELASAVGWHTLRITGDFNLMLWEWDVEVADGAGTHAFPSGYSYEPILPSLPGGTTTYGRHEERQTYLYATDAVLEFSFDQAPSAVLSFRPEASHLDGRVTLGAPDGFARTPDGERALAAGDSLEGELELSFSDLTPASFRVGIAGSPRSATLGGAVVAYPAAPARAAPWLWAGLALATVALSGGGALGRRLHLRHLLRTMEDHMEGERYEAAARAARPALLRSRRHRGDAQVIRAVALLRLGRLDEAASALAAWRGPHDAIYDYLRAYLHALRGERAEARLRLQACLRQDASLGGEVSANPVFAPLLGKMASAPEAMVDREGYT